jgi:hypothetical protein
VYVSVGPNNTSLLGLTITVRCFQTNNSKLR